MRFHLLVSGGKWQTCTGIMNFFCVSPKLFSAKTMSDIPWFDGYLVNEFFLSSEVRRDHPFPGLYGRVNVVADVHRVRAGLKVGGEKRLDVAATGEFGKHGVGPELVGGFRVGGIDQVCAATLVQRSIGHEGDVGRMKTGLTTANANEMQA
jgi:hypothetical protein